MANQFAGQTASARPSTKGRKPSKSMDQAIARGKDKSSKANKTPATGMGR